MAIHSDMQGPCPNGFHVPLNTERQAVYDAGVTLGIWSSSLTGGFKTYLKLPFAGYRTRTDATVTAQGYATYWSSVRYDGSSAYRIEIYESDGVRPQAAQYRSMGQPIRGFKNIPVTPDSSWTVLYQGTGSAGVYHNSSLGLISISSDGINWITIADKNLGATTVYNSGDTLSEANCGGYFQRGNNYMFPFTGSLTTSSTKVDASNYGPGNYYSSITFITTSASPYRWDTTDNGNLWGGVTQGTRRDPIKLHGHIGTWHMEWVPESYDYSDMQGPAPEGYHVPFKDEWVALCGILTTTFGLASNSATFKTYLKMPTVGTRSSVNAAADSGSTNAYYWSSSRKNSNDAYILFFGSLNLYPQSSSFCSSGNSIRCFKNSPAVPDSSWTTLYDGSSVATGAGVFHNATLGLISVSGDGSAWYTIQDKNLGATTVYNNGDTFSQENCGNYYQRGNNYGFPFSGGVTTSSTQVDASNCGPGNYYSSSTFITRSAAPKSWDITNNYNLRGGETGVTPGHYKRRTGPYSPLKSYEEIVAMATAEGLLYTNTLNELNTYPIDYYNMLNNGGYYGQNTTVPTNHIIGIEISHDGDYYYIYYNNGTRSRWTY